MAEAVKVIVRCRPINEREQKLHCKVLDFFLFIKELFNFQVYKTFKVYGLNSVLYFDFKCNCY